MSRWMIEKDGTGIEKSGTGIGKSGTGIERAGTGIEKSGTGIEKSGTGIEKSGTGIRKALIVFSLVAMTFASGLHAGAQDPAGALQLVVNRNSIAVSWIIDGSVFSGVAPLGGSYVTLMLTEIALSSDQLGVEVTGAGTGNDTQVTGAGTGGGTQVTGAGTGGGTQVTGAGTGINVQVTGAGTGSGTQVTGAGTGNDTQVTGAGTGNSIQVTGAGTGTESITITLPEGTGLAMEVSLNCSFASVTVLDTSSSPVVAFDRVPVIGDAGFCSGGAGGGFWVDPGQDFALGNF